MTRIPLLVQGDCRDKGDLILRFTTFLNAREFSAEVGVIDLEPSPQQTALTLSHRSQNLVVQQSGGIDFHTQVAAQLQQGEPGLCIADQGKGQEPGGQMQFDGLYDRGSRERSLMATVATLRTL